MYMIHIDIVPVPLFMRQSYGSVIFTSCGVTSSAVLLNSLDLFYFLDKHTPMLTSTFCKVQAKWLTKSVKKANVGAGE